MFTPFLFFFCDVLCSYLIAEVETWLEMTGLTDGGMTCNNGQMQTGDIAVNGHCPNPLANRVNLS